ncbi:hypothetical protein [Epilithonimonas hominis]|uniref:hypothetical protein n=1 Tax=Epilithonimonas hominis TaxID=420404 RepID=UPI0028B1E592|nr:hypothetical protein [Epilithonimonas hominis]
MKRETASKEVVFFYEYKNFDFAQCDISNTKNSFVELSANCQAERSRSLYEMKEPTL